MNQTPWKNNPKNMNNQLHTICSYMAMFPASLPNHIIQTYSKEGDRVLDPFSGRGTTILESCNLNRESIASDKNPLAIILSKAKARTPQKGRVISRLIKLEKKYNLFKISTKGVESNIKMIFSNYTLKQMIFLKNNLNWKKSNVDNFITAMILGIIHGSSSGYLSLSMPNTFSMSPNYVRGYIKKHKLTKPKRNVFRLLEQKLERCYQKPKRQGKVYNLDARNLHKIKDNSVDLIVTSPPYTRLISYGSFNWIRLWFLNHNSKTVDKKLFTTVSTARYCNFMTEVLVEFSRVLKKKGTAALVIGDVKNFKNGEVYNLAEQVWTNCAEPLGFEKKCEIIEDVISEDSKVSKIWGDKRGNATKIDRILILKKTC